MAARLLLTPAGGGKTSHVIARIRELPPLAPARVILPGRLQAVSFRQRLARAGGALAVEVQTFYDLYSDLLALSGGEVGLARLPTPARRRLLRHLVARSCDAGQLPYYAPLRDAPGFARLLGGLFEELKRARVLPEDFEAATADREPRLHELAHLYTAYQEWLIETGWADAEGQGWLAALALERDPTLLSDMVLLAVDGFDEFNPTQLAVLRLLADRAGETIVTLTGSLDRPDRLAHRRSARARAALAAMLPLESGPPPPAPPPVPASLAHLEKNLFELHAAPTPAGDAVTFLEAQTRAAEAREALRWLKARIVRDRVPPSNTAIVARDVAPYCPFLEEVAAEFGIPLRFASAAPLRANPAVAALLNLLALLLETVNWAPRALLDALTSPYFDWAACGLLPGDADRLGDVARAGQVVAGLDQWRESFRRLADRAAGTAEKIEDQEGVSPRRPPAGAELERLESAFEDLVSRVTPPPSAALRERVAWVESLLVEHPALSPDALHLDVDPATGRDRAALDAFRDVLHGLLLAESVIEKGQSGNHRYGAFLAELAQAIDEATYPPPFRRDALLVASVMEVRGLTFDSVALLGLAEGDFPHAEQEDVLLRESDRALLAGRGLPLERRLRGDEPALFYQAVTRARRRLLLCRPYLADDGQPWEPSPYWDAALGLFAGANVLHVRPADPLRDPASPQESAIPAPPPRSEAGDLTALTERLAERFGPAQPWSSSRLETYAKCPFYFWAAYGMRLEPRELPQIGFDVLILGSIYHLILERLYRRVPDGDPDRLRAELDGVAQEVYDSAPNDYGFRPTPLWERQQEELTQVLCRTLEALIEIAGDYKPTAPELAFGLKGKQPLVLGEGRDLQLRGYIDRVDRATDGRLRIIDYKAGSTSISARDLTEGRRLQLPLYALAAERALGAKVASGFYWHIGSARPSSLKLEKYQGGVPGAIEMAVGHALRIVTAVRAGHFAPTSPDSGCPPFCPAAAFCEQYKPRSW